jgi:hypothetical protein
MNPVPRGAAADDMESIALRPSLFSSTAIPGCALGVLFSSELCELCVVSFCFPFPNATLKIFTFLPHYFVTSFFC